MGGDYWAIEWQPIVDLAIGCLLTMLIGVERQMRLKSAGLRTYSLVGLGAALFTVVSKYGFTVTGSPSVDYSRVAAQIVSGIGFLGAGVIFVRRDAVRGLTTAAAIWLTAAIGMAAGAGLPVLAAIGTAFYLLVSWLGGGLARLIPTSKYAPSLLRVDYSDGRGVLRLILPVCIENGFQVNEVRTLRRARRPAKHNAADEVPLGVEDDDYSDDGIVSIVMELVGTGSISDLSAQLADLDGVLAVGRGDSGAYAD